VAVSTGAVDVRIRKLKVTIPVSWDFRSVNIYLEPCPL